MDEKGIASRIASKSLSLKREMGISTRFISLKWSKSFGYDLTSSEMAQISDEVDVPAQRDGYGIPKELKMRGVNLKNFRMSADSPRLGSNKNGNLLQFNKIASMELDNGLDQSLVIEFLERWGFKKVQF